MSRPSQDKEPSTEHAGWNNIAFLFNGIMGSDRKLLLESNLSF